MLAAAAQPPVRELPRRKHFTRSEVEQMLAAGLFVNQRFELIDGDLIDKMGQNPPHASVIQIVFAALAEIFGMNRVQTQLPIEVSAADRERSWPEPDLAVLAEAKPDYWHRHPSGDELLLALEVADSSVQFDAVTKRDLYARAGVPEYWVLDINLRKLTVHQNPALGKFAQTTVLSANQSISPASHPDISVRVADMLP